MKIHCSRLFARDSKIIFGMSTRVGGVSPSPYDLNLSLSTGDIPANVHANRERFFGNLNIKNSMIAFPLQVHSAEVRYARKPGEYPVTDGLVTDLPDVYLAVTVADCLPVFLFDPEHDIVAAVHAGWKGSESGIASQAVSVMKRGWKTDPSRVLAYMGPSAGKCCYEVGEDVAARFASEYLTPAPGGKHYLDIPEVNKNQLIESGLREENIEHEAGCTICNSGIYHSYRRDGKKSGRMMGIIGMKPDIRS